MKNVSRKAWGHSIFCDDIRVEIDMKITIVGIYPTNAIILGGAFPATIAKLGIFVRYTEEPDAYDDNGVLEVYFPGEQEPRVKLDANLNRSREFARATKIPEASDIEVHAGGLFPIVLSPVVIKEPGYIRVKLRHGDTLLKLGACEIIAASSLPAHGQSTDFTPTM